MDAPNNSKDVTSMDNCNGSSNQINEESPRNIGNRPIRNIPIDKEAFKKICANRTNAFMITTEPKKS